MYLCFCYLFFFFLSFQRLIGFEQACSMLLCIINKKKKVNLIFMLAVQCESSPIQFRDSYSISLPTWEERQKRLICKIDSKKNAFKYHNFIKKKKKKKTSPSYHKKQKSVSWLDFQLSLLSSSKVLNTDVMCFTTCTRWSLLKT
jgi:hypothetical protein